MTKPEFIDLEIDYPDDNGETLADNTRQLAWVILIKTNFDVLLAESPLVFIGGDLLWYPIESQVKSQVKNLQLPM